MSTNRWDSAADWNDRDDRTPPPAPMRPTSPLPARGARRLELVVCCPFCESMDVERSHYRAGDVMAYWRCRACTRTWKEPAQVGTGRIARLP